jgi:hypothetical protein
MACLLPRRLRRPRNRKQNGGSWTDTDQQRWHKNLAGGARSLLGDCEYYPVEGAYEEVPFVLMRRARHEVDRDCSVFRDGLCVSRDLNLVNALLLTETWAEDLPPPTRGIATST